MFYLIGEKDGLVNDEILVNVEEISMLDTHLSKKEQTIQVRFTFKIGQEAEFKFTKDTYFNVDTLMTYLSQLEKVKYKNPHILLTDYNNIQSLSQEQFYLHKFSKLMVCIDTILLAYIKDNNYYIRTAQHVFQVSESPKEIFDLITSKVL